MTISSRTQNRPPGKVRRPVQETVSCTPGKQKPLGWMVALDFHCLRSGGLNISRNRLNSKLASNSMILWMCALPNYYVKHDSLPLVSCGSLRSINQSSPVYRSSSVAYIISGLADPLTFVSLSRRTFIHINKFKQFHSFRTGPSLPQSDYRNVMIVDHYNVVWFNLTAFTRTWKTRDCTCC